jgi:hypothetical protein
MSTNIPGPAGGPRRSAANHGDVLSPEDRRRLQRRAARLEADRDKLREAMREAQEHGASLRNIAAAVEAYRGSPNTHTGVAKWLAEGG